MIIQNILWPQVDICMQEDMYFRKSKAVIRSGDTFLMKKGDMVWSDTYFNSVSCDKWKKYTNIGRLNVTLKFSGVFRVRLYYKKKMHNHIYEKNVYESIYQNESLSEVTLQFPSGEGMAFFNLEALGNNCQFTGGYYSADIEESKLRSVKIAIGICTFRRETFIEHNLQLLNKYILNNPSSELYNHLEVFISDNGKTLEIDKLSSEHIHIVQNKNAGGAGGFTRDMIEILNTNKNGAGITHILLMDDDIIIDPESLLKTYRLLSSVKDTFKDSFIGGAMLRNDAQNIQVESGASWNAGKLVSLKSGLDMNTCDACLYNEIEEYSEYNAWWYCCFPAHIVTESNLPMPIFIRGDDLEYGLRNMKHLILMNGICVWHEPFENKYSSYLSYYILRNQFIDNALHFPKYGKRDAQKQVIANVIREILYFRYKNVDLIVRGVRDFLSGIDWLIQSDGEALHQEIMAAGYKAQPIDDLPMPFSYPLYEKSRNEKEPGWRRIMRLMSINGYLLRPKRDNIVPMAEIRPCNTYRARRILNYDVSSQKGFITERNLRSAICCLFNLMKILHEMDQRYTEAARGYRKRHKEVQNLTFWKQHLEL